MYCGRCGQDKPREQFYISRVFDSHHKTERHPGCIECRKKAARTYYREVVRPKRMSAQ